MRGWSELYRTSLGLGVRYLRRHGYAREAVIRLVVPLDPSRYLELPWALDRLGGLSGQTVLDLASPKLLAVTLARRGLRVTTLDQLESEIAIWRRLAEDDSGLQFVAGDGRAMPFEDASFDHATSISVLEHVAGDGGDATALGELVRCVRPGGKILVTLPYAAEAYVEYRKAPAYADHGERDERGRSFFQRWYDDAAVQQLVAAVPALELMESSVARLQPNLSAAYLRTFPLLVPLGPVFGLLARERRGPGGDVIRLLLVRN
jgi:ubiquinone/menaquinone biosynthesis C-methylase UbiE